MVGRQIPLILLSGMGADERVFAPQMAAFPHLVVPKWLEPVAGETLSAFGKRMAEAVDPGEPCFLGGASFGGMVAMEMQRHLDVRAVILIGSVRGPNELPLIVRLFRPLAIVVRLLPFEAVRVASRLLAKIVGRRFLRPHERILLRQLGASDAAFLRWAIFALLKWRGIEEPPAAPVFHIHGDRDLPLPIRNTNPTSVVRGGGHVISLSHAEEVTEFLRVTCESVLSREREG